MPLICFSGRAAFGGQTYRQDQLRGRIQGMDITPAWFPSPNAMRGDVLFCSEAARAARTRTVLWFVQMGSPIYDYGDLFSMWMSSHEARVFAATIQIDMPNEGSRIAAKQHAADDRALAASMIHQGDGTPEYSISARLRDRRAAARRNTIREQRGLIYETIPRLGEAMPLDMDPRLMMPSTRGMNQPDPVSAGDMNQHPIVSDEAVELAARILARQIANEEEARDALGRGPKFKTTVIVTHPKATIERPLRRIKL